jgi:hypothetical protein
MSDRSGARGCLQPGMSLAQRWRQMQRAKMCTHIARLWNESALSSYEKGLAGAQWWGHAEPDPPKLITPDSVTQRHVDELELNLALLSTAVDDRRAHVRAAGRAAQASHRTVTTLMLSTGRDVRRAGAVNAISQGRVRIGARRMGERRPGVRRVAGTRAGPRSEDDGADGEGSSSPRACHERRWSA